MDLNKKDSQKNLKMPIFDRNASVDSIQVDEISVAQIEQAQTAKIKNILGKLFDPNGNLDMRNVTTLIWANRSDKTMVQKITEQLIANSNERTVFNGVEFYLPQLAHMIIHLDVDITSTALEQFSLVICQQSLHVALQLNWILVAALEDYQPELSDGNKNPKANSTYFKRCIELLQNVERIVALGSPSDDGMLQKGPNKQWELIKLKLDRANCVITNASVHSQTSNRTSPRGFLWHKQWTHRKGIHNHRWIKRWFSLEDRVLYCYREPHDVDPSQALCFKLCRKNILLKRAIVLHHATIQHDPAAYKNFKYEFYFTITSPMGNWRLRAESEAKLNMWVKALKKACDAPPLLINEKNSSNSASEKKSSLEDGFLPMRFSQMDNDDDLEKITEEGNDDKKEKDVQNMSLELDKTQIERYQFFNSEREFVRNLTDICEELRFLPDRDDRGPMLEKRLQEVVIPPVSYLPLVKSTDRFKKIIQIPRNESRAFSTKARCPALVTFETISQHVENHDSNGSALDVANFLHWNYMLHGQGSRLDLETSTAALHGFHESNAKMDEMEDEIEMLVEDRPKAFSGFFSPSLKNIWRKDNATALNFPSDLFSPFSKSFKTPNFKFAKFSRRFSKNDLEAGKGSAEDSALTPTKHNARQQHRVNFEEKDQGIEPSIIHQAGEATHYGSLENFPSLKKLENTADNRPENSQELENIRKRAALLICNGESLSDKVERLRRGSKNSSVKGWGIERVISKSNDDLRQEVFIMQLISFYLEVFRKEKLDLWLQPYRILSTSKNTGLIQVLDDSASIHGLKKDPNYPGSLSRSFEFIYGKDSTNLERAKKRFAQSLAGYSVVSYLLAFKDRHNGNIMINMEGRIIHIDFGFVFGQAPGGRFSMERAPFKLTKDYVGVLGGPDSELFKYYEEMVGDGLNAARKYAAVSLTLLEITMFQSEFPCFAHGNGPKALEGFKRRLMLGMEEGRVKEKAREMVRRSSSHWGTVLYDKFQLHSNGIKP
mmetsp:Transcript_735/g.1071  ORF Transcript_735/g.1071 Transcript_735/m.1071 type:complete len:1002 (-) Transcript_735:81-3086(-)